MESVEMEAAAVREAEPGDLHPLHALVEAAYRGDSARRGWTHEADLLGGQRTDAQALAEVLADPAQAVLVIDGRAGLCGCVVVSDKGGGRAHLGLLAVDPGAQGGGLGRRLIAAAEHEAAKRFNAAVIEMTVIRQRPELIAYYERRGYAATGREEPFPLDDPRFGLPVTRELVFVVLAKAIGRSP